MTRRSNVCVLVIILVIFKISTQPFVSGRPVGTYPDSPETLDTISQTVLSFEEPKRGIAESHSIEVRDPKKYNGDNEKILGAQSQPVALTKTEYLPATYSHSSSSKQVPTFSDTAVNDDINRSPKSHPITKSWSKSSPILSGTFDSQVSLSKQEPSSSDTSSRNNSSALTNTHPITQKISVSSPVDVEATLEAVPSQIGCPHSHKKDFAKSVSDEFPKVIFNPSREPLKVKYHRVPVIEGVPLLGEVPVVRSDNRGTGGYFVSEPVHYPELFFDAASVPSHINQYYIPDHQVMLETIPQEGILTRPSLISLPVKQYYTISNPEIIRQKDIPIMPSSTRTPVKQNYFLDNPAILEMIPQNGSFTMPAPITGQVNYVPRNSVIFKTIPQKYIPANPPTRDIYPQNLNGNNAAAFRLSVMPVPNPVENSAVPVTPSKGENFNPLIPSNSRKGPSEEGHDSDEDSYDSESISPEVRKQNSSYSPGITGDNPFWSENVHQYFRNAAPPVIQDSYPPSNIQGVGPSPEMPGKIKNCDSSTFNLPPQVSSPGTTNSINTPGNMQGSSNYTHFSNNDQATVHSTSNFNDSISPSTDDQKPHDEFQNVVSDLVTDSDTHDSKSVSSIYSSVELISESISSSEESFWKTLKMVSGHEAEGEEDNDDFEDLEHRSNSTLKQAESIVHPSGEIRLPKNVLREIYPAPEKKDELIKDESVGKNDDEGYKALPVDNVVFKGWNCEETTIQVKDISDDKSSLSPINDGAIEFNEDRYISSNQRTDLIGGNASETIADQGAPTENLFERGVLENNPQHIEIYKKTSLSHQSESDRVPENKRSGDVEESYTDDVSYLPEDSATTTMPQSLTTYSYVSFIPIDQGGPMELGTEPTALEKSLHNFYINDDVNVQANSPEDRTGEFLENVPERISENVETKTQKTMINSTYSNRVPAVNSDIFGDPTESIVQAPSPVFNEDTVRKLQSGGNNTQVEDILPMPSLHATEENGTSIDTYIVRGKMKDIVQGSSPGLNEENISAINSKISKGEMRSMVQEAPSGLNQENTRPIKRDASRTQVETTVDEPFHGANEGNADGVNHENVRTLAKNALQKSMEPTNPLLSKEIQNSRELFNLGRLSYDDIEDIPMAPSDSFREKKQRRPFCSNILPGSEEFLQSGVAQSYNAPSGITEYPGESKIDVRRSAELSSNSERKNILEEKEENDSISSQDDPRFDNVHPDNFTTDEPLLAEEEFPIIVPTSTTSSKTEYSGTLDFRPSVENTTSDDPRDINSHSTDLHSVDPLSSILARHSVSKKDNPLNTLDFLEENSNTKNYLDDNYKDSSADPLADPDDHVQRASSQKDINSNMQSSSDIPMYKSASNDSFSDPLGEEKIQVKLKNIKENPSLEASTDTPKVYSNEKPSRRRRSHDILNVYQEDSTKQSPQNVAYLPEVIVQQTDSLNKTPFSDSLQKSLPSSLQKSNLPISQPDIGLKSSKILNPLPSQPVITSNDSSSLSNPLKDPLLKSDIVLSSINHTDSRPISSSATSLPFSLTIPLPPRSTSLSRIPSARSSNSNIPLKENSTPVVSLSSKNFSQSFPVISLSSESPLSIISGVPESIVSSSESLPHRTVLLHLPSASSTDSPKPIPAATSLLSSKSSSNLLPYSNVTSQLTSSVATLQLPSSVGTVKTLSPAEILHISSSGVTSPSPSSIEVSQVRSSVSTPELRLTPRASELLSLTALTTSPKSVNTSVIFLSPEPLSQSLPSSSFIPELPSELHEPTHITPTLLPSKTSLQQLQISPLTSELTPSTNLVNLIPNLPKQPTTVMHVSSKPLTHDIPPHSPYLSKNLATFYPPTTTHSPTKLGTPPPEAPTTLEPLPTPIPDTYTSTPVISTTPKTNSTTTKKKKKKVWKIPFYPNDIEISSDGQTRLIPKDKTATTQNPVTPKPILLERFKSIPIKSSEETAESLRGRLFKRFQIRRPSTIPVSDTALLDRNRFRQKFPSSPAYVIPSMKSENSTIAYPGVPTKPTVSEDVFAYLANENLANMPTTLYNSPEEREEARKRRLRTMVGLAGDVRSLMADRARHAVRAFSRIVGGGEHETRRTYK